MKQMTLKRFHFGLAFLLCAGAVPAIGCMAPSDEGTEQGLEQFGTVHLPLVTPAGATYRLHNASFVIRNQSNTPIITLDSESDPGAETLSATLNLGPYTAQLLEGWELDSVAPDGTEAPVHAALITSNPQSFQIRNSVDTDLTFSFTTDDGVVVIGTGSVNISVDVAPNTSLASCDLLYSYTCATGTCLLADSTGKTFCAVPGSLPVGSPCTSEQCVAGSQCLNMDPSTPDQGICTQFCNTAETNFGCNCASLGLENTYVGICTTPPAGACDLLTQTGCADGEACQYSGGNFGMCGVPGTSAQNEACDSETCIAGYSCYSGACRAICDTNQYCNVYGYSSYCYNVGTGTAGRCL